ncbi:MAG: cob(I)yrinic acid a,c-diamide adenosyltransferase [Thermus sp.]|nr:cob(I)yrinic acid a,c-diamide adenosyltransferase [Thermus sp.]MDW8018247.1 cob(I)yrinic acid a,c-diamide adenosyltransferase [Thermus sp.]
MEEPKRVKPYRKPEGERRGLLVVYTGEGKGKSTAAFGLALRAHGRGLRVRIFQFLKHRGARFGEHRAFALLGVPVEGLGDGFTWRSRDLEATAGLARTNQETLVQASPKWGARVGQVGDGRLCEIQTRIVASAPVD